LNQMLDQTGKREIADIAPASPDPGRRRGWGLSARLLAFLVLFVMLSEVVIYVPSIANFRVSWLGDRMTMADAASAVLLHSAASEIPREVQSELLNAVGATAIGIRDGSVSRLIAVVETPPVPDQVTDLRTMEPLVEIYDAFATLAARSPRTLRVIDQARSGALIEVLISDRALRSAMLSYSVNVLWLSAVLSLITGALLYLTINRLLVRPMRHLTRNMIAFSEAPEDHARVIIPSGRADEIGIAEARLASMQRELQDTLRQQRRLADLGLAVSKINHDLRNMLASAQLFSDRLGSLPDPTVQRFAPKLIGALDRAIAYCQNTLAYGRAREDPPVRRLLELSRLVDDVAEVLGLAEHATITWENAVPADLEIDADPDQLFRVLVNLCRNAVQALESDDGAAVVRRLTVSAFREGPVVTILVHDTGPGVPAQARAKLFQAFHGSVRPGGTGLGLAIAAELAGAHGGSIDLQESDEPGSTFRIIVPDRGVATRNQSEVATSV
jgi:signal transduction histidine kinase